MARVNTSSVRPILYALVLFTIIGISLATETLSRFGLSENYFYIISAALLFVALLLGKKPILVLVVLLGVMAINLPESILLNYTIDRDMLLAAVCAIILGPTIYNLIAD